MDTSPFSVFVYGTLQPGGRYWPEFCEGKLEKTVAAKIRGELYDLQLGYPGLVLSDVAWVQGYVLNFKNEAAFLQLDDLEGYAPDRPYSDNEYIRKRVQAYSEEGEPLGEVWVYEITRHVLAECRATLVPEGNWPA